MKKPTLLLFILLSSISFLQMDCKDDEPVKPCTDCPQPLDTTSHNFTFTTYTFGGTGGSSYFNDVAIINDSDIWAVGQIYTDSATYNAAHWDGKKWELKKISVNFRDNIITPALDGIFTFSSTDIWFVGSLPIHGNGQSWEIFDLRLMSGFENVSLSKAWGVSSSNIYFVGGQGSVVHYNGSVWTKLESGTTLDIQDIWGGKNEQTGEWEILAIASNKFSFPQSKKLLKITDTIISSLPDSGLPNSLSGLWFISKKQYYVVGDGLFKKNNISTSEQWQAFHSGVTTFYTESIRGNASNDIIVSGDYGTLLHFNGKSWHNYQGLTTLFYSVAIKNNLVVAVGQDNPQAAITVGRRQ